MSTNEDIARLNARIEALNARMDEHKEYLNRIEDQVDTVIKDIGRVGENMAKRDDVDQWFRIMATKNDVDRLWGIYRILMAAILTLLVALIIYVLTKQPKP